MRFLGITETCDLGALYMRLLADGHEVRVTVSEEKAQGTMAGLVPRAGDWQKALDWIRAVGDQGILLFEAVSEGLGALQDQLRKQGFTVIGGSAFGDRLENDRAFAQNLLAELGLQVAGTREFDDAKAADAYIAAHPGRYVLKYCGPEFSSGDNYVPPPRARSNRFAEIPSIWGQSVELVVRMDAVDARIETPDDVALLDVLEEKDADAVDRAGPKVRVEQKHIPLFNLLLTRLQTAGFDRGPARAGFLIQINRNDAALAACGRLAVTSWKLSTTMPRRGSGRRPAFVWGKHSWRA